MKIKQLSLLVALTVGFVTLNFAQPKHYDIKNGFAIGGGISQFNILTDNFNVKAGNGWLIHASATGDLPHRWYNISYGMQLAENKFEIDGRPSANVTANEAIKYKLFTAQAALLMHIKPFQDHFTIDVGPMLQYNGKIELEDKDQETYYLNSVNPDNLQATDIAEISKFGINGAVGATLGFKFIKLRAQYIHGFTNILKKLNDQNIGGTSNVKFEGNQSMLVFMALITF